MVHRDVTKASCQSDLCYIRASHPGGAFSCYEMKISVWTTLTKVLTLYYNKGVTFLGLDFLAG